MKVHAAALAAAGDKRKLVEFLATVRRMALLYFREDLPWTNSVLGLFPLSSLSDLAETEELPEESAKLKALRKLLTPVAMQQSDRLQGIAPGSMLHFAEWSPGNRANLVTNLRFPLLVGAGVFTGVAVLLLLRLLPAGGAAGETSRVLYRLADRKGMAGLLLVAVGLPVVVLGAGLGLMPEHLRGAMSSDGVTSLDSFLANLTGYALFAGLVAAVQMARMEIARRTAFLGLRPRWWQMGLGWGALALCFAAVAAYLLYVRKPAPEGDFSAALTKDAAIAFAALPLLWLMAKHAIGLFRRGSTLRHRLLARRLIAPVLMMALLQLAGLAVLHGMERRIIAHDPAHLWSRLAPGPARSSRRRWTGFRQSGRGDGTGAARGISRAAPLRFPFSGAMGLHVEQAPRT